MLVFTRKRDQTIVIGEGIEVRVLRIGREGVRLGITAPATVPVHRREVYDTIRCENRRAAGASLTPARLRQAVRSASSASIPRTT